MIFERIVRNGHTFVVKHAVEEDIPKIGIMVYREVFPLDNIQSDESPELEIERWLGRYETYPEGLYVVEHLEKKKIVAAGGTQIIDWNYGDPVAKTWVDLTDDGTIRKTHRPDGNTHHLVTHVVHRDYTGFGLGGALMRPRIKTFNQSPAIRYMIVGHSVGRSDSKKFEEFKTYLGDISKIDKQELEQKIASYATQQDSQTGLPIDPVTRFYHRHGFRFIRVLIGWENYPEYNFQILQAIRKH